MRPTRLVCYEARDDQRLLARDLAGEMPRYTEFVIRGKAERQNGLAVDLSGPLVTCRPGQ